MEGRGEPGREEEGEYLTRRERKRCWNERKGSERVSSQERKEEGGRGNLGKREKAETRKE